MYLLPSTLPNTLMYTNTKVQIHTNVHHDVRAQSSQLDLHLVLLSQDLHLGCFDPGLPFSCVDPRLSLWLYNYGIIIHTFMYPLDEWECVCLNTCVTDLCLFRIDEKRDTSHCFVSRVLKKWAIPSNPRTVCLTPIWHYIPPWQHLPVNHRCPAPRKQWLMGNVIIL
jgi:hypothetical protein